jgi:thiol-disulfide isomerase/thioredoxin
MNRRHKRTLILMTIATMVLFLLLACTGRGQQCGPTLTDTPATAEDPSGNDATSGSGDSNSQAQKEPPDFQMTVYQGADVLGGETVQIPRLLEKGRPIVLNFWAGLCPPCRLEMPDLQEVNDEYQDQILLVGVDVGPFTGLGSREDGRALLQELGVTYPAGTTSDAGVVQAYQVIGMPSTYFITPEGKIVRTWTGLLTKDKMGELVDELMQASG